MTRDELIEKLKKMPNLEVCAEEGMQWPIEKAAVVNRIITENTRCGEEAYISDEKIILLD